MDDDMILVFTTSIGVASNAATKPAQQLKREMHIMDVG